LTKTHHRKTAFGIAAFRTGLQKEEAKKQIFNTAQKGDWHDGFDK
jgi:hypothetical protein